MSENTPATRGWLHQPTHAFGKGAVALVSVALVGVVAVTPAWTRARTAAPVHLYWARQHARLGFEARCDDDCSGATRRNAR